MRRRRAFSNRFSETLIIEPLCNFNALGRMTAKVRSKGLSTAECGRWAIFGKSNISSLSSSRKKRIRDLSLYQPVERLTVVHDHSIVCNRPWISILRSHGSSHGNHPHLILCSQSFAKAEPPTDRWSFVECVRRTLPEEHRNTFMSLAFKRNQLRSSCNDVIPEHRVHSNDAVAVRALWSHVYESRSKVNSGTSATRSITLTSLTISSTFSAATASGRMTAMVYWWLAEMIDVLVSWRVNARSRPHQ